MKEFAKKIAAVVTAARNPSRENTILAEDTAEKLNIPFVRRGKESIADIKAAYDVSSVLVAKNNLLYLDTEDGEMFFHPNIAHLRLKNIRMGEGDRMVKAMKLKEGMSVLDCTMGLAADSVVAAFVVGDKGKVAALESSPLIAAVVERGLKNYPTGNKNLRAAMARIDAICADHEDFLPALPAKSYDVVYFDPMFRHPFMESSALMPMRKIADARPLSEKAVKEALRVAKERVILKESRLSGEFARLGFAKVEGGKYSKISYGVIEKNLYNP